MTRRLWAPNPLELFGGTPVPPPSPVYPSLVVADGATSYWRLGESTGVLVDSITGVNNLTANGAPTRHVIPGGLGTDDDGAITFPLATDYLTAVDTAVFDLGNANWSIEFLLRMNADSGVGTHQCILNKGANAYGINIGDVGGVGRRVSLVKPGVAYICEATPNIAVSAVFTHFVITRTGSGAGNTLMYTNGVEGHADLTIASIITDTASQLEVGREGAANASRSSLDELAFYKGIVLTPAQIAAHVAAI